MRIVLALLIFPFYISAAHAAPKGDLSARSLDGRKVHLKDLRGKLVVLTFWASWCAPCKDELPLLVKAAQANPRTDLAFLAISVDDSKTQPRVPEAAKEFGIAFPVWVGASSDDLYRLSRGEAVPATVFIDRDGTIEARVSGEIRESELKTRLEWLTGDRRGLKPQEFVSHAN